MCRFHREMCRCDETSRLLCALYYYYYYYYFEAVRRRWHPRGSDKIRANVPLGKSKLLQKAISYVADARCNALFGSFRAHAEVYVKTRLERTRHRGGETSRGGEQP